MSGKESVSVGHRRQRRRVNQETPPMRIYIIGNDGITLCREAPQGLLVALERRLAADHPHPRLGAANRMTPVQAGSPV